jgi:hypothetical protein
MPVEYTNQGQTALKIGLGKVPLAPGEKLEEAIYLENIPAGCAITKHLPSPFRTIHADVLPATHARLSRFKTLMIDNSSGAEIVCVFNEDEEHPLTVPSGRIQPIKNDYKIWSVDITGEGEGKVYITGALV